MRCEAEDVEDNTKSVVNNLYLNYYSIWLDGLGIFKCKAILNPQTKYHSTCATDFPSAWSEEDTATKMSRQSVSLDQANGMENC